MNLQFGAYPLYIGPVGINLTIIFLGLFVLVYAVLQKIRVKKTHFFEISFLLFMVGFLFMTLHGRLLQFIFPISLPEKPLIDNNLTLNYALSNLLAFMVLPLLALVAMKSKISFEELGLKVNDIRKTTQYAVLGVVFNVSVFLLSKALFGFKWIFGYTLDGLVFWTLLVTVTSVFIQTFFFVGILFKKYMAKENALLLAVVSVLAFQSFAAQTFLPWLVATIVGSSAKVLVTWKTHNIYSAVFMGIAVNLVDSIGQIL